MMKRMCFQSTLVLLPTSVDTAVIQTVFFPFLPVRTCGVCGDGYLHQICQIKWKGYAGIKRDAHVQYWCYQCHPTVNGGNIVCNEGDDDGDDISNERNEDEDFLFTMEEETDMESLTLLELSVKHFYEKVKKEDKESLHSFRDDGWQEFQ